ncbi:MAG TPA: NUDIX domain-containing protein [Noviherbaspirillum sp.]|nr:NUDIX domain-containing protein [Noviherbaspirillum sp.]
MKKQLFPLVTADIALFTLIEERLSVLLVQRANEPFIGQWAIPGGVLDPSTDSDLEQTARRILQSKINVKPGHLEQVKTVSGAVRDPRGWSISILFSALLPADQVPAVVGDKTQAVQWCDPQNCGHKLAFDHQELLEAALEGLRKKVRNRALPLHLLPSKFTLTQVQRVCERVLGQELDKGTFRRQLRENADLVELEGEYVRGAQRPAQLYTAAPGFVFKDA